MSGIQSSIERIRAYAKARGWGGYRMAREAGCAPNTGKNLFSDEWNPTVETVAKFETIIPSDFQARSANGKDAA